MEWLWDLLVNLHWGAVGQIIMIDILLGGDNAVVIALACRNLPHEQRLKGVFWGTFGAIALRVVLITFAVMLLDLPFLKMVGAALLVWIGVKLLVPEDEHESEKIEGTRNEYHTVKQAEYEIFDGKHEAIIPDDLWQAAQVKRGLNAYKREKRYSPEHAHILSGLIKCPVCGAPMYGVVNRKKKKDGSGEFYTDMWYYICKNTKTVSGQRCTYTKHIRQDDVNEQVRRVVQEALRNMDFTEDIMKSIGTDANLDALQAEADTLAATKKKEERQKSKLLSKIMELDADDDLYDEMYDDLQGLLRQRMKRIAELDSKINQVSIAIQNAGSKAATAEEVYATMRIIVDMMDIMPERDEQEIMHALLDSVQIYPERQPNGLWIKSVRFKVPLEFDGVSSQDVIIDNDSNSLPNESIDETVLLLKKTSPQGTEGAGARPAAK